MVYTIIKWPQVRFPHFQIGEECSPSMVRCAVLYAIDRSALFADESNARVTGKRTKVDLCTTFGAWTHGNFARQNV